MLSKHRPVYKIPDISPQVLLASILELQIQKLPKKSKHPEHNGATPNIKHHLPKWRAPFPSVSPSRWKSSTMIECVPNKWLEEEEPSLGITTSHLSHRDMG
jgi:hypothetical protein